MNFSNAQQRLNALPIIPAPAPGSDPGSGPQTTDESGPGHGSRFADIPKKPQAAAKSSVSSPLATIAEPATAAVSSASSEPTVVTPDEVRVLRAVRDHPGQKAGAYAKLARMGAQKCSRLRRQLVSRGLLAEEPVQLSASGRSALIVTLTAPGKQALEDCS